jgi:glycogen(starch) synthase
MKRRILINSHSYAPSVGGSETACELLAEGFSARGFEVVVVTTVPGPPAEEGLLRVVRQPTRMEMLRLIRWADVVIHSNISLRAAWLMLFCLRPWIVIHHTSLTTSSMGGFIKQLAAFLARNISVSRALARTLFPRSNVLGNGYRDSVFKALPNISRDQHLIFVGRLVSTKGACFAVEALAEVRKSHPEVTLTIVGDGPERENLAVLARKLQVADAVRFTGALPPPSVAEELNRHRVLLAPSIITETFGLVVVEAIACGCVPIVSNVGGLPESAGKCGLVVKEGCAKELALAAERLLSRPEKLAAMLDGADRHLNTFRSEAVIDSYLAFIRRVSRNRASTLSLTVSGFVSVLLECAGSRV